ncbi:hypothetical protein ACFPRL_23570 [Pseudoclavibacter helvolus]
MRRRNSPGWRSSRMRRASASTGTPLSTENLPRKPSTNGTPASRRGDSSTT